MNNRFRTSAAYVSGGICGTMWMPASDGGKPFRFDLTGYGGFVPREQHSFRDVLLSCLMRDGGDFQNPVFTADTIIRIERHKAVGNGQKLIHVKEIEVSDLPDCDDLVSADRFVSDFLNDD